MYVEDIITGYAVKVPRKVKKQAKKNGVVITGCIGKTWLAVEVVK